jgi:diaminohydroxyphosphoribosylaminopyrimidine deaminase/5-amino-6-(5-phosphoribosylamino)uracil reductase
VAALAEAGPAARGGTLVVTLEPCAHEGKQPPCARAVAAAGIVRVVAALTDPNPVAGGGAVWLREQGVAVDVGLMADAARAQNAAFLHRLRDSSRPFVALKLATSLDGRIADADGNARWVSGPEARDWLHWLRAGFDAIAVGGSTARLDDPSLTARGTPVPRVPPSRVVFSRSGTLPTSLSLVRTARAVPTVLFTDPGVEPDAALGAAGVAVHPAVDLAAALRTLRSLGVTSLLVEGGGALAGALLTAGLVDRYYWVQAPLWLGAGPLGIRDLVGAPLADAARWRVVERRALGEDTLLVVDRNDGERSTENRER